MSSPPPYQTPTTSLKRPSISSATSQPIIKKQRMHPLRQTSFPANLEPTERSFGGTSDAGSVTGSFTGSLDGTSADGIFAGAARGKKRGRKSKADKERERDDAMSTRTGDAGRFGSADAEGSVRGGMGGGRPADDGDDYDDDDDEGELLGREEGATDTEAEKKNLAYVLFSRCYRMMIYVMTDICGSYTVSWWMHSIPSNPNDTIYSSVQSYAKNLFVELSTTHSPSLSRQAWSHQSMVLPRFLRVR